MAGLSAQRVCLLASNVASASTWARVVFIFAMNGLEKLATDDDSLCTETLRPAILVALTVSLLDLVNALFGLTRSNPIQVLLFSSVRIGTEILVTPLVSCGAWQHLMTTLAWSIGDMVRCGCFSLDALSPKAGVRARSIRYTVGPLLFPIGATGEMLMVIRAAMDGRPILYAAAALWPFGFYPLMKQLLKQRRKHFHKLSTHMKQN